MRDDLRPKDSQIEKDDQERAWLAIRFNLSRLPNSVQNIIWAAAIPHWFDAKFLSKLIELPILENSPEFAQLLDQPYIEVFQGQGWKVHERTRNVLLQRLWDDDPNKYRELSSRAADFCNHYDNKNNTWEMERIYHTLICMPIRGVEMLNELVWKLQAPPNYDYDKASKVMQAALEHANAGRLEEGALAWTLYWDAYLNYYYSNYELARELLLKIEIKKDEDQKLAASYLKTLGDVSVGLEDFELARNYYKEAIPLFVDYDDYLIKVESVCSLGDVNLKLSKYEEARKWYNKALKSYQKIQNHQGEAYSSWSLGNISMLQDNYSEARDWYKIALSLYRGINDFFGEAYCLDSLGSVYINLGEYELSASDYKKAADFYQYVGKIKEEANCYRSIGDVYMNLEKYRHVSRYYKRAMTIFQEIGDRKGEADCNRSFGDFHMHLKNNKSALRFYNEAILIYREIGDSVNEANCADVRTYILEMEGS